MAEAYTRELHSNSISLTCRLSFCLRHLIGYLAVHSLLFSLCDQSMQCLNDRMLVCVGERVRETIAFVTMQSWLSSAGGLVGMHRTTSVILASAAVVGAVYLFTRRKKRIFAENAAVIHSLTLYPIKSLPGIPVPTLDVERDGVSYNGLHDRSVSL